MLFDINSEIKLMYDTLQISLDKPISTLESNYYINKVCLSYSKLQCLNAICDVFLNNENIMIKVDRYELGCQKNIQYNIKEIHLDYNEKHGEWLDMRNHEEVKVFFKLFNVYEMPLVYIRKISDYTRRSFVLNVPNKQSVNPTRIVGRVGKQDDWKRFNYIIPKTNTKRNPTVSIKKVNIKKNAKHPIRAKNIKRNINPRVKAIRKKRNLSISFYTQRLENVKAYSIWRKRNPTVSIKKVNIKKNAKHPIRAKNIKRNINPRVKAMKEKRNVPFHINVMSTGRSDINARYKSAIDYLAAKSKSINNRIEILEDASKYLLAHDFDNDALKIVAIKHFSPPKYFVEALEHILKYLITNKREEELHKIKTCIQHQEYLYKDLVILEKIVSISKVLKDENVPDGIKVHVLNTLQTILCEQEELHKKMGVSPTITHIDLLA